MDPNLQNVYRPEILIQMELCTSNLERHLKKRNSKIRDMGLGELSVDGAFNRELAIQMLSAIEFLHQKNVIHRDIKVDIFAAGMVLFEAYQIFYTGMEKVHAFDIVRNRKNKREFVNSFPSFARNWPSVVRLFIEIVKFSDDSKQL
ncbi:hypothetical protein ANCCAN_25303 [Ancylostoma caninum]|uniref:Protein kinase domain-containing protein n=1 Tax=Ancylostoma caninum TaxID=29170 RepID=A0A368F9Y4_ANCCA|nr:hypothetical protein ANCCAN_25303 [Ancylostoma caninum]